MDCSLPGSSAHGIFQARVLEWVAIAFSAIRLLVIIIINSEKQSFQCFAAQVNFQFSSVAQSCLTLCDPWTTACQPSLSITNSWSLLKLVSIKSVTPFNRLILCHPLLLLPLIFPTIRVFSKKSVLLTWPSQF